MSLVFNRVAHERGGQPVLREITLSFAVGSRCLLIGPNGAGKTTFLRLAVQLDRPQLGAVECPYTDIGFFSHEIILYKDFTLRENLRLFQKLSGAEEDIKSVLAAWLLDEQADQYVRNLSRGEQTRAALARAFLGMPELLVLDEPTNALDESSLSILVKQLQAYAPDAIVIVASHQVDLLAEWANRIIVLDACKVVYDTSTAQGVFEETKDAAIQVYRRRNR